MNRQDIFLDGLQAGRVLYENAVDHNCNRFDHITHLGMLANASPFGLTRFLFIPPLKQQGTDEQISKRVSLAKAGKIIGSYAQTELGHGTQVRGIETTATFDKETDEFVINSPTLTSTKYWPDGIGFVSTHTVLMARMIIDGEDHGVHAFIIQLRSMEDFKPIPGIELGDIGYALLRASRITAENSPVSRCRITELIMAMRPSTTFASHTPITSCVISRWTETEHIPRLPSGRNWHLEACSAAAR
jgi:acyl-CoA oxidase